MNGVVRFARANAAQSGPPERSAEGRPHRRRVVVRGRGERVQSTSPKPSSRPPVRYSVWHPWEVLIALLVLAGTYSLKTEQLRLAPVGLIPGIVVVLLVAMFVAHFRERRDLARMFAIMLACVG